MTHELFSPRTRVESNEAGGIDTGAHRLWSLFSRAGVARRDDLACGYPAYGSSWYLLLTRASRFLKSHGRRRRQVRAPSRRVGISSFAAMSCYRASAARSFAFVSKMIGFGVLLQRNFKHSKCEWEYALLRNGATLAQVCCCCRAREHRRGPRGSAHPRVRACSGVRACVSSVRVSIASERSCAPLRAEGCACMCMSTCA